MPTHIALLLSEAKRGFESVVDDDDDDAAAVRLDEKRSEVPPPPPIDEDESATALAASATDTLSNAGDETDSEYVWWVMR